MKKIIYTAASFVLCTSARAQLGITAGMNLAKYSYAESRFDVHRKSILAYNAGFQYRQKITERLFVQPGLSYSLKGSRVYYDYPIGSTGPMKNVNKFQYVQLQLPVLWVLPVSDGLDFEAGAGLFVAYLFKAAQKTVEFDDSYISRNFASGDLKKIDAGLQLSAGFRMAKHLGLHFSYEPGFLNIQGIQGAPAVRTRNFSINISWLFSKND